MLLPNKINDVVAKQCISGIHQIDPTRTPLDIALVLNRI
jgi:hypothetical protein